LSVGAGYFYANGGNTTVTNTNTRTWTSTSDTLFNTVINAGFASAKSIQIVRVGGQYVIGAATVGVAYSNTQYATDAFSTYRDTA
ncbi:hypothetical protein ACXWQC_09640, partial [Streptococcus pyogenes]